MADKLFYYAEKLSSMGKLPENRAAGANCGRGARAQRMFFFTAEGAEVPAEARGGQMTPSG
jgi:hypothetical protein